MYRRKKEEEERKRIEKLKADKIEREKRRIEVENRIALEKKKADLESNETQNRSEIDSKEKADEAEGNFDLISAHEIYRNFLHDLCNPYFRRNFITRGLGNGQGWRRQYLLLSFENA